MGINAQQKGKEGEREVARELNGIVDACLRELGLPPQDPEKPRVQRNQNQSAVGGCDLSGTFELAIEVKRQETLSINTWWKQCTEAANALGHHPVLVFRQNTPGGGRKNWRVITLVDIPIPGCEPVQARAEVSYDDFKVWFKRWALEHLMVEYQLIRNHTAPKPAPIIPGKPLEASEEGVENVAIRQRIPDLFPEI